MVKIRFYCAAATMVALLISCATAPKSTVSAPGWVTTTPRATSEYTYFVGSGSDTQGNIAAANENADHSLVADVTRYLGVTITSQTTVETKADLKSFQTRVEERIRESSSATIGDFTVADRWIQRDGDQVTVFLLGKYKTQALEAERTRLRALERERTDAVSVPEKEGDALVAQGRAYEAASKFMEAALAATGANIANSKIKFERTIKKAGEAVSSIGLAPVADSLQGMVDQPLPHPFLAEVTATAGSSVHKLSKVPFLVSYPILRSGGRTGTQSLRITSNTDGNLTVSLPPPQLIGKHTVTATLDLSAALTPLLRVPAEEKPLVASLEQQINAVRIVFHYSTTSMAASIPTGVLVMDLDRGGSLIPQDDAAAGIVNSLTQAGYDILPIPSNPSIVGIDAPDLVTVLRNNFGDKIKRAIIGSAKISGFEKSGDNYIVKVSGDVEVADLASGKVLFSTTQLKLSRASDATSAITAAFKDLGTSIGEEISNSLH
ncbi:MAG TPA: hypothetical protein VMW69_03420 [Spirochaetia bacterium]|nr:hypothetical protein [Spirochaetia bacterium]